MRGTFSARIGAFLMIPAAGAFFFAGGCSDDGPGLPEDPPEYVLDWGSTGDPDSNLKRPVDVAVGPDNTLFVADIERECVLAFTTEGEFLNRWDVGAFVGSSMPEWDRFSPGAIGVDTVGVIFVGDVSTGRMARMDTRTGRGELWDINAGEGGIDVAPDGSIYVVGPHYMTYDDPSSEPKPYILKLSTRRERLAQWTPKFPPERPWSAGALVCTPEGGVLVLDVGSNRVQEYDAKGGLLADWPLLDPLGARGRGLALGPAGRVYVSRWTASVVEVYSRDGRLLSVLGEPGPDYDQFQTPGGMATDASGALYVTDFASHRVQKFAYP